MSYVDLTLLFVIGVSGITGFFSGFLRVGIGLMGTVIGIFAGLWFYGIPEAWILQYISSKTTAAITGFLLIFFGFVLIASLIGRLAARLFKLVGLSWADRLAGAAFGVVRGAVMSVVVVTILLAFSPSPLPKAFADSKVMPYASRLSTLVAELAPREFKDAYHQTLGGLKKIWLDNLKMQHKRQEKFREKFKESDS